MSEMNWQGDKVKKKMLMASLYAINKVMAECVIYAKSNHPGWKNITGAAEGSVRITQFAIQEGGAVVGKWGSTGLEYPLWLELKHGSFLRNAADNNYKNLAAYIKNKFSGA